MMVRLRLNPNLKRKTSPASVTYTETDDILYYTKVE
jgi:hypothetical protein